MIHPDPAGARMLTANALHERTQLRSLSEFQQLLSLPVWQRRTELENELAALHRGKSTFQVVGYSESAGRSVPFRVDRAHAASLPNWRESLVCPETGLNNRMRAVVWCLREILATCEREPMQVYAMEQVTPFYRWLVGQHRLALTGSEWLGVDVPPGEVRKGIRHENVHGLSFPDARFDVVISQDVMEHVPDPWTGFRELARVLRPGGYLVMSVPFYSSHAESRTRARLDGGRIVHLLPAEYHGNPMPDRNGSLVFTDFGWDILPRLRASGFRDAWLEAYWSYERGHLGQAQLIFLAQR